MNRFTCLLSEIEQHSKKPKTKPYEKPKVWYVFVFLCLYYFLFGGWGLDGFMDQFGIIYNSRKKDLLRKPCSQSYPQKITLKRSLPFLSFHCLLNH